MEDIRFLGRNDASTVDLNDAKEVEYWKKRFSITEEQLREVVARVGVKVEDVMKELEPANRPAGLTKT